MKNYFFRLAYFISVLSLLLFFGCKNNAGPNLDEGQIKAITITEGDNTEGYMLQFKDNEQQEIASNDTLIFDNKEYGTYEITLDDLPDNCSVSGENPVTVQVETQNEIVVTFEVICSETPIPNPDTGSLEIITRTSLINSDQTYTFIINGSEQHEIAANDTLLVDLKPGNYNLELDGVTPPCRIDNGPSNEIIIEENKTYEQDFYVFCQTFSDYKLVFQNFKIYDFKSVRFLYPDGKTEIISPEFEDIGRIYSSPDLSKIAFTASEKHTDERELYSMNADGTNLIQITNYPGDSDVSLFSWSPDTKKIAFSASGYIYVIKPDGSELTQLTHDESLKSSSPDWSPDGKKIVFRKFDESTSDIYIMNIDGSNLTNITNSIDGYFSYPDWSPDGSKISFNKRSDNTDIFLYYTADARIVNATKDQTGRNVYAVWAPDGAKIAYVKDISGSPEDQENIYVMNADGSNPLQLTHSKAGIPNQLPAWSPDGQYIAFGRQDDFNQAEPAYHIMVIKADGTEINDLGAEGCCPNWLPLD